jgi:hypothetical protein
MEEALRTLSRHHNHAHRRARAKDFEIGLWELPVVGPEDQKIWAPAWVELAGDDQVRLIAEGFEEKFPQHLGELEQDDLDRPIGHAPTVH